MQGYPHFFVLLCFLFFSHSAKPPCEPGGAGEGGKERERKLGKRRKGRSEAPERVGNERAERAEKGEKKSLVIAG